MADIRINALATTAASTASDDFVAVDGSANGTRKLNAFSPTFGGNLTVSGTGTSSVAGTLNVTGALLAHQTAALNLAYEGSSISQLVAYGADASTLGRAKIVLRKAGTGTDAVTAADFTSTGATLSGDLTVSTGFILNRVNAKGIYTGTSDNCGFTWTGTNGEFSTASGSLILKSAGTTALTLDSSQNATFAGNINAGGASNDADIRLHLNAAGTTSAKYAALWRNSSSIKIFHLRADGDLYTSAGATITGAIAIGNTVQTAVGVASTHKVTISIGGTTYYLLATNV